MEQHDGCGGEVVTTRFACRGGATHVAQCVVCGATVRKAWMETTAAAPEEPLREATAPLAEVESDAVEAGALADVVARNAGEA